MGIITTMITIIVLIALQLAMNVGWLEVEWMDRQIMRGMDWLEGCFQKGKTLISREERGEFYSNGGITRVPKAIEVKVKCPYCDAGTACTVLLIGESKSHDLERCPSCRSRFVLVKEVIIKTRTLKVENQGEV